VAIDISFEESYTGATKKIAYSRMKKVVGAEEKTCETCNAHGSVVQQIRHRSVSCKANEHVRNVAVAEKYIRKTVNR